jgi:hypothetical protein
MYVLSLSLTGFDAMVDVLYLRRTLNWGLKIIGRLFKTDSVC